MCVCIYIYLFSYPGQQQSAGACCPTSASPVARPAAQPRGEGWQPGGFLALLPERQASGLGRRLLPEGGCGASDCGLSPGRPCGQRRGWCFGVVGVFFFFKMWLPSSGGNAADLRPRTGNPITNHPPPARDPSPPPGTCPGAESRSGRGRWRRGGRPAVPPPVLPWFAAAGARRGPGITYSCVQAQRRTEVAGMKKAGPCSVGSGSQSRLPPSHLLPILANLIPTRFRNLGVGTHRLPHLRFVCLGSAVGPGPSCAGMRHRAV